jgi:hypothetical protein
MPLVRTPMIAPTKIYKYVPTLSPEEAADLIAYAIVKRPKKIATNLGRLASITYAIAPDVNNILMSIGFNLFPSSTASVGAREIKSNPTCLCALVPRRTLVICDNLKKPPLRRLFYVQKYNVYKSRLIHRVLII